MKLDFQGMLQIRSKEVVVVIVRKLELQLGQVGPEPEFRPIASQVQWSTIHLTEYICSKMVLVGRIDESPT